MQLQLQCEAHPNFRSYLTLIEVISQDTPARTTNLYGLEILVVCRYIDSVSTLRRRSAMNRMVSIMHDACLSIYPPLVSRASSGYARYPFSPNMKQDYIDLLLSRHLHGASSSSFRVGRWSVDTASSQATPSLAVLLSTVAPYLGGHRDGH
jgi:hypothetical protein